MDPLESNARTCPSTKQQITTVKNSRKLKYKHIKHNALIIQRYFQKGTFKDLKERIHIKLLNEHDTISIQRIDGERPKHWHF
jgi:hypothetical protein